MEVSFSENGDIAVAVKGLGPDGNPSQAQIEFLPPSGGGVNNFRPKTMEALRRLAKAMEEDSFK